MTVSQSTTLNAPGLTFCYLNPPEPQVWMALLFMDLDNVASLNACIDAGEVPRAWLITLIRAIRKHGKRDFSKASEYRAVGLESWILKILTLTIHIKLFDAAQSADGIIGPPSHLKMVSENIIERTTMCLFCVHG